MSKEYDALYSTMINAFEVLRKIGLYNLPGLKGVVYKYFSHKASRITEDKIVSDASYNGNNIIVSLTTFGTRTNTVYKTIISIINQKLRPERIILWLDENEFSNETLPIPLMKLKEDVEFFEIRFCENLKPHKKYYYSMLNYPANVIVTADDDVYYPSNWLEKLYECYIDNPECVCCINAHRMHIRNDYSIDSYNTWEYLVSDSGPDICLCPIGVGGVLYPPHILNKEVFDKNYIIENCLNADDLWLKVMSLINGVKIAHVTEYPYTFLAIDNSQNLSLSQSNVLENRNDEQLTRIMGKYGKQVKSILCKELSQ